MAIQTINDALPDGDSPRKVNEKINENFSNKDHAASRLVGTGKGQIPLSEDAFKATFSNGGVNGDSLLSLEDYEIKEHLDSMLPGDRISKLPNSAGLTGQPTVFTLSTHTGGTTFRGQLAIGYNGNSGLSYRSSRSATVWGDWADFYNDKNTKKDSNTNLLLASGDTIPNESAASRLVGYKIEELPTAPYVARAVNRSYEKYGNAATKIDLNNTSEVHFPVGSRIIASDVGSVNGVNHTGVALYQSVFIYGNPDATKLNQVTFTQFAAAMGANKFWARSKRYASELYNDWVEFYHSGNTTKDTATGFLKVSSPVLHVYNDNITKIHEANQLDIIVEKKGVGHYEIHGTTGLRKDDGWFMSPPRDVHGNVLCMVDLEEKDGVIILKTYKKLFDFETVSIVHDYDNPMDIPEGVCVEFRFNDLPEDLNNEPVPEEEPIVDDVEESEAVDEPMEEPEVEEEPEVNEPVVTEEEPVVKEDEVPVEDEPKD